MMPRSTQRPPRSRVVRGNLHQPRLESLAAEFALLTQRRARSIQQIALLDQQRAAAASGFARLQQRIAWLMQRMDRLGPEPREPEAIQAPELEPPPVQTPPRKPGNALAMIGRHWANTQPPARPTGPKRI